MSERPDLGPLVEVKLLRLPVAVWASTQQHTDELMREFTLIAEQVRHDSDAVQPLPVRLVQLVEDLTTDYSGFSGPQEQRLFAAAAAGENEIDLTYEVPAAVGPAARHLGDLLNEADDYCRAGQHLLTLTTPAELVRFRAWFLEEFVQQVDGRSAVAWPDYQG